MKTNRIYYSLLALGVLAFASCDNEDLDASDSNTPSVDGCASVEFDKNSTTTFELDPSDTSFELNIVRRVKDAATYNIVVENNDSNAFIVPETVTFAEGDTTAIVSIKMTENAPQGSALNLQLSFDSEDINPYTDGTKTLSVNATIIKWESIGTCYWVDGLVCSLFGVDADCFAVQVEKAVTSTATKFRFASPYAYQCTGMDEAGLGYIGYRYNDSGDCDNLEHMFVITVEGTDAYLDPVESGMSWSDYGMFSFGTIYGNLSSNIASYPLGTMASDGSKIVFPAKSLYVYLSDYDGGYTAVASNPSTLYLVPDELFVPDEYQPYATGYYDFAQLLQWPSAGYSDYCYFDVLRSTEDTTKYRISGWDLINGGDFDFTVNDTIISFEDQYAYSTKKYGEIDATNFVETQTYFDAQLLENVTDTVAISHYSKAEDTYYFNILYKAEAGPLAYGYETLKIVEYATKEEAGNVEEAAAMRRLGKAPAFRGSVVNHKDFSLINFNK